MASDGSARHTEHKTAESDTKYRDKDDDMKPMRLQQAWEDVVTPAATASYECFALVLVCRSQSKMFCVWVLALTMFLG